MRSQGLQCLNLNQDPGVSPSLVPGCLNKFNQYILNIGKGPIKGVFASMVQAEQEIQETEPKCKNTHLGLAPSLLW